MAPQQWRDRDRRHRRRVSRRADAGVDGARCRARRATARERPLVVFVTAYDDFALPAFETDAIDYVTKPVAEERFDAALDRVRAGCADALRDARGEQALGSRVSSRGCATSTSSFRSIIDYIEADDVYAAVHARGKRHLVRVSLDALERSLDPDDFLRIHRSLIVRLIPSGPSPHN